MFNRKVFAMAMCFGLLFAAILEVQNNVVFAELPPPLPTITFSVWPKVISEGNSSTATWNVTDADSVWLTGNGIGTKVLVASTGTQTFSPSDKGYVAITAKGPGGLREVVAYIIVTAPPIAVLPTSLSFGEVGIGQTASLRLYVRNLIYEMVLGLGDPTITGTNAGEFSYTLPVPFKRDLIVQSDPPQELLISFRPTSTGAKSGNLVIWYNIGGSEGEQFLFPLTISLAGIGVESAPPPPPPSPPPVITFNVWPQTVMVGNLVTVTWEVVNADSVWIVGKEKELVGSRGSWTFPLPKPGTFMYTLVAKGPGGMREATVQFQALAPSGTIAFSPTLLSFGEVGVGQKAYLSLKISRSSGAVVRLGDLTVTGSNQSEFSYTLLYVSLNKCLIWSQSGQPPEVLVSFSPTSTGAKSADLVIWYDRTSLCGMGESIWESLTIPLSGSGAEEVQPPPPSTPPPPPPPLPTVSLSVSPTTIQRGQSAILTRESTNATSLVIDGIGSVGLSGSVSVSPSSTTTYVARATGPGGTAETSVTLTVTEPPPPPPPSIDFSAMVTSGQTPLAVNFTAVNSGGSVTSYTWSFGDGASVSTSGSSVSYIYTAAGTYSVSVSASGPGGSDTEMKTNLISASNPPPPPPPPLPTVSLSVSPTTIQHGQSAVLNWSSANTDSRMIDQGIGLVGVSGSQSVSPTTTTIYTARVTGPGGTKEVSVILTVTEPPPPPLLPLSPKLVVADPPKDFGEVIVGARMSYNARLWNENEGSLLVVSALEIAGRDAGDFSVSPSASFSLIGKNYKDIAVIFLPGSAGRKEAELIIRHNGAESPLVISITGQGLLPPLAAPDLTLPSNGAQNQPVQLILSWSAVPEALLYRLQVATDSAFSRIVFDRSGINTSFMQIGPLSNNTLYYWRAQSATAGERFSQWSALGRFTTTALTNPKPIGRLVFDLDPALGDQKKVSLKGVSANQTIPLQIYADEAKNLSGLFLTLEFDPETLVFQSFKEAFGFNPGLVEIRAGQVQLGSAIFGVTNATAKNGSVLIGTVKLVTSARFTSQSNTAVKIAELTVASLEEPLGRDQPLEIFSSAIATLSGERTLLADFNSDGKVDFKDFLLFAQNFGKKGAESAKFDLNNNGSVDFTDFVLFAAEFGKSQPSAKLLTISDLLAYLPEEYSLMQNFPNPFNSETTISYELPEAGSVKLAVYDLSGQEIKILTDGEYQPAGQYQAIWNGQDGKGHFVSSGLYLCRLEVARQFSYTRKMVFSK